MRVIRHESGWDIALDMVFTDKATADIVAKRIQHAVYTLIRDAVDASRCVNNAAVNAQEKVPPLEATQLLDLKLICKTQV